MIPYFWRQIYLPRQSGRIILQRREILDSCSVSSIACETRWSEIPTDVASTFLTRERVAICRKGVVREYFITVRKVAENCRAVTKVLQQPFLTALTVFAVSTEV